MLLVNIALRLLRLAGEAIFFFEVNRILGRCISGTSRHRRQNLSYHQSLLLRHIHSPYRLTTVHLPSGLHLHTLIAGADVPGPRPLVLLHGHSMAAALFAGNVDALLDAGYSSVLAPDLPGWGSSSRPRFKSERVEDAVQYFLAPFVEWVAAVGLTRFTLLGHSLGAYVAYEFAQTHGAQVERLILTAPAAVARATDVRTATWFALTPQRLLTHGGLVAHLLFAWRYPSRPAYNVDGMRDFLLCANSTNCDSGDAAAAAMLRFWRVGGKWRAECVRPLLERVSKLACPVDLISGDSDRLVHVENVRALYWKLLAKGNLVSLNVLSGVDHSPHLCDPVRFCKAIVGRMLIV